MKIDKPFENKNLALDTNLKITALDHEKSEMSLASNSDQNFIIKSEYLNPNNINLEIDDEFEFSSKSDIVGGNFFQLKHLKSNKILSFNNFKFG